MQDPAKDIHQTDSISKTFWRFALPSVAAMVVSGIYQVIDGFFVGHYIGAAGLAGINMAWPILGAVMGLGIMLGMGGGSLMSIYRGEQDASKVMLTLSSTLWLVIGFGIVAMLFLHSSSQYLLYLQGAKGEVLVLAEQYIAVYSYGAIITLGAGALPMLVRNDDSPHIATGLLVVGAVLNIVLDYLFIGVANMGLAGAAIATVIAQSVVAILGLLYFLLGYGNTKIKFGHVCPTLAIKAVRLGSSSLFMFMYYSLVIALHNKQLMLYASPVHVAAFAIIGYIATLYYLLAEGVASGLQPPVSYYFGAQQYDKVVATVKLAVKVIVATGIGVVALVNLFPVAIISFFSQGDAELLKVTSEGMRLHLFGLYLDGFLFLATVYFMAVGQGGKAVGISVANIVAQLPFLYLLPQWYGVNGVWLAVPISNLILVMIVAPVLIADLSRMGRQSFSGELKSEAA